MANLKKISIDEHRQEIILEWDNDCQQRITICSRDPDSIAEGLVMASLAINEQRRRNNI